MSSVYEKSSVVRETVPVPESHDKKSKKNYLCCCRSKSDKTHTRGFTEYEMQYMHMIRVEEAAKKALEEKK